MPKFTASINWKASPGDLKYYSNIDSLEGTQDSLVSDKIHSFLSYMLKSTSCWQDDFS